VFRWYIIYLTYLKHLEGVQVIPCFFLLQFLNEHGGSSNAYTSGEHTNYYFDVSPEHQPISIKLTKSLAIDYVVFLASLRTMDIRQQKTSYYKWCQYITWAIWTRWVNFKLDLYKIDNVSEWGDMSIRELLFQWANTTKIQLSMLV
jgi:hypothetical protein